MENQSADIPPRSQNENGKTKADVIGRRIFIAATIIVFAGSGCFLYGLSNILSHPDTTAAKFSGYFVGFGIALLGLAGILNLAAILIGINEIRSKRRVGMWWKICLVASILFMAMVFTTF